MFERWAGRKMALHQLIRGHKSGSDLRWTRSDSGHLLFCFAHSVNLLCPDVHVKERCVKSSFTHSAETVKAQLLQRQSDIWQQHLNLLKLLVPVYNHTLCDITGCNAAYLSRIRMICSDIRVSVLLSEALGFKGSTFYIRTHLNELFNFPGEIWSN